MIRFAKKTPRSTHARAEPPKSDPETASLPQLYQNILHQVVHAEPCRPVSYTGFRDPDIDTHVAEARWLPVWRFPSFLVKERSTGSAMVLAVDSETLIIGVRAGGDIPEKQRGAYRNTEQSLTIIMNGRTVIQASYVYDGSSRWQYFLVNAPDGFDPSKSVGCEIERDGRLMFSGSTGSLQDFHLADKINIVRFLRGGLIEGWATYTDNPDVDVFLKIHADGQVGVARSGKQWRNDPLRMFRFATPVPANNLAKLSAETFKGAKSKRSPVWGFFNETSGFLIANPRIDASDKKNVLLTIVPEDIDKFLIEHVLDNETGQVHPLDQADAPNFKYYEGKNTVQLPLAALEAENPMQLIGKNGRSLGHLPSLKKLLPSIK